MSAPNRIPCIKIIIQLLPYIWMRDWHLRMRIIISIFLTFVAIALNVTIPVLFKNIVNTFYLSKNNSPFFMICILIGYGLIWTISQVVTQLRSLVIYRVLERGMRKLSITIVEHLLSLSMRFHLDRYTGALTSYINRAQMGLDQIFWSLISFLLPVLVEIVVVIAFISYLYGPLYGIALCIIVGSYLSFSFMATNKALITLEMHNQNRAAATARVVDSLLNVETVKYFNNEKYEYQKVDCLLKQREDSATRYFVLNAQIQIFQVIIIGLGLIYLTTITGKGVYDGIMNVGDFVLINGYILQFVTPLNHFGYIMHQLRKGIQDMQAILNILSIKPEITDSAHAISLPSDNAEIVFHNVHFGYQAERPILNGISFTIPAGKTLAIVGPSGAGKSSIARLLFRFYDVQHGSITINGHDIRNVTQQSLHNAIGIVPQDVALFNDTLYHNITYGNPCATHKELEIAIKLAHLNSFIDSLPEGLDTIVGERGLKLSGGEKQRVAIARTVLKKPFIFIFDEATSSLDSNSEREIQKNLEEISCGATTIIIAHRLSTITKADTIMVLNKGVIVETGTHSELLYKNGLYAQLWYQQHEQYNQASGSSMRADFNNFFNY